MENIGLKTKLKRLERQNAMLIEENALLRDELSRLDKDSVDEKVRLAFEMYEEYEELCEELRGLRKEYNSLLSEMKKDIREIKKLN